MNTPGKQILIFYVLQKFCKINTLPAGYVCPVDFLGHKNCFNLTSIMICTQSCKQYSLLKLNVNIKLSLKKFSE